MNLALKKMPLILKHRSEKSAKEEDLTHHPSFPYYGLSERRLEHIHIIKDELEVKAEFSEIFVESFCTPSLPSVWCYEFEHQEQSYLIAQLGPRFVVATHNFSVDVSEDFKSLHKIPLAVFNGEIPNTPKTAEQYNATLRKYVVQKIKRVKNHDFGFTREAKKKSSAHYPDHVYEGALSLNPFSGVFKQQATYIQDEFMFLWETFVSKIITGPFNRWSQDVSMFIHNEKHFRQRKRFSGPLTQTGYHRARMGTILKKIRALYDKETITLLYRIHFFNFSFANWLSHPDPVVRLYRQQAVQSHSFLIPYFHLYLCLNTNPKVEDELPFDSNPALTHACQVINKEKNTKIETLFNQIDAGNSTDDLLYEAVSLTSSGHSEFSDTLFYASEMEQLLKTGIRRLKKIKFSLLGLVNLHGHPCQSEETLDYYIKGMIIQFACVENKHVLKSKKKNLAMAHEFIKNLKTESTPRSLGYLEPFLVGRFPQPVAHPYKKEPLAFKHWFNMVYKQSNMQQPSSWALSETLTLLKDTLRTTHGYQQPERPSYSFRSIVFSLFAKHSLASMALYVQELHALEARTREQYRLEHNTGSVTSWKPLLKENPLVFNSKIEVRELTTSDELFAQGQDQNHCVGGYTSLCVQGHCRIFSIVELGNAISTVCLNNSLKGNANFWRISQNYASHNEDPLPIAHKAAALLLKTIKKEPERVHFIHIVQQCEIAQRQEQEDAFIQKTLHEYSQTRFPSIHLDLKKLTSEFTEN